MTDRELTNEMIKRADEFVEKQKREFAITELEKMKDRLEVAMWYNRRDKEYCLELIDKEIAELKGGAE